MSRRARLVRTALSLSIVAAMAVFVPAKWSLRLAVVVTIFVMSLAWILCTVVALALDFYWPPKKKVLR